MFFRIERLPSFGICSKRDSVNVESENSQYRFRDGLYQSFVSLAALSLMVHFGLYLSLSTILYPQLNITKYQNAWIASIYAIGQVIFSPLHGPLSDKIGRKRTCIFAAILTFITWALTIALPQNFDLYLLYIIRFISGIAAALLFSSLVYVSEVTNRHWRSTFLAMVGVFMASGILVASIVGSLVPWRSYAIFCLMVSLFNIIILTAIPESPHWLQQSDPERAKQTLMKLNRNQQDFNEEWAALEARRLAREGTALKDASLFSREVRRPMLRLAALFTFQMFGGVYLVIAYALQMFHTVTQSISPNLIHTSSLIELTLPTLVNTSSSGPSTLPTLIDAYSSGDSTLNHTTQRHPFRLGDVDTLCFIGVGIIRVLMAGVTVLLTKHINNRVTLISSLIGGAVSAFAFAAVFSDILGQISDLVALGFILLFQAFQSYGMLVVPWALIGELIPLSYRAKGSGIMISFANLLLFSALTIFPYAVDVVGLSGVFTIFGFLAVLASVHVYFFIPETRGRTLTEIDDSFKHDTIT